jgi:phosphocarrier protein
MMKFAIENSVGLHARPAALFVRTAQAFESEIIVKSGDKQGNAKSLLSILSLGVGKGTEIVVEAHGSDAEEALQSIKALIDTNFGEIN